MNFAFHQVTQLLQVNNISCFFIRFSGHLYFQFIIMSMIMGQGTFTKYLIISSIIPVGVEQPVTGIEVLFSEYSYFPAHKSFNLLNVQIVSAVPSTRNNLLNVLNFINDFYTSFPKYSTYILGVSYNFMQCN